MRREISTYGGKDPKSLEIVKNSLGIFKRVSVEFGMPCEGECWSALECLSAFSKKMEVSFLGNVI